MNAAPPPRVRVRPNRNCLGLAAVLAAMGYAGASQTNGAAYLLGFTLASLAAVSLAHAWANLRGVQLAIEPLRSVFAGESIRARLRLSADSPRARCALRIATVGGAGTLIPRLASRERRWVELDIPAERRGHHATLLVEVRSLYPLGFFTASCRFNLPAPHYSYPRPEGTAPLPVARHDPREVVTGPRSEGSDFAGLRSYRAGDSQRHIDWKAVARGQPMLIKQWAGDATDTLILDYEATPGSDPEARLSQLARWLIQAERDGLSYGLHLPDRTIAPDSGDRHFHACLRALAEFPA